MADISFTEIVGYTGAFFIVISFLMKGIIKLRITNTVGCLLFVLYGILFHYSYPVILTNVSITIINIYYLLKKEPKLSK